GKVTNRPITYGRSLRAAALATYARPQDTPVLKSDVAWLVQAQIGGAYTYDDLYKQLIAQGEVPTDGPGMPPVMGAQPPAPPRAGDSDTTHMPPPRSTGTPAKTEDGGDFNGGSP